MSATGAPDIQLVAEADADLVLYISNQSFEDSPIDIEVAIDGVTLVARDFAIEGGHNWLTFPVSLPPGEHTIAATSSTGASTEETFEVLEGARRWAALDYWYSPDGETRKFTWYFSIEPIKFA